MNAWPVDLEFVFSLAAVFWLHGWRRAGADDVLLAVHTPWIGWRIREPWGRIGPLILATWWPALVCSVEVSPERRQAAMPWQRDLDTEIARGRRRLRRVRHAVWALRVIGIAYTLWIVVGVPLMTARFGVFGLLWGLAAAIPVLVSTGICTWVGLRLLEVPIRQAMLDALRHCGPFSAPFAAGRVTAKALEELGTPAQLLVMLGPSRFDEWIRAAAYDARHAPERAAGWHPVTASVVADLPDRVIDRAITLAPPDLGARGSRFCPRCGGWYREAVNICASCAGVPLEQPVDNDDAIPGSSPRQRIRDTESWAAPMSKKGDRMNQDEADERMHPPRNTIRR